MRCSPVLSHPQGRVDEASEQRFRWPHVVILGLAMLTDTSHMGAAFLRLCARAETRVSKDVGS